MPPGSGAVPIRPDLPRLSLASHLSSNPLESAYPATYFATRPGVSGVVVVAAGVQQGVGQDRHRAEVVASLALPRPEPGFLLHRLSGAVR